MRPPFLRYISHFYCLLSALKSYFIADPATKRL